MQMRFGVDDEEAFGARRDDLGERFAQWLNTHDVPGDPNDAGLLLDWKWGYGDGDLSTWTVADVREFLFEWCPRKLSTDPADCPEIPLSVAAFVEFLAHTGALGPGSAAPSAVRRYCEKSVAAFVREMGNPANFGMAKSLFASAGALGPGADDPRQVMAELTRLMQDTPPEHVDELLDTLLDGDPPIVGPVRLPGADERLAAVRDVPVMRQLRSLADYCAPPGRALTGAGNLRIADARHLVDALATGDDVELGGCRNLRSADDLPELSWLVRVALEAGAVRRQRGRLVAVARFAALDEVTAHAKVVRAAVAVEDMVGILVELLDAGGDGVEVAALADPMPSFARSVDFLLDMVRGGVRLQVKRLAELGVISVSGADECAECADSGHPHSVGGTAALTAGGTPLAVELARDAGVEVLVRPDPVLADAAAIADLGGMIDEEDWARDAAAWFAAQTDPAAAAVDLVAQITSADREPVVVMAGLSLVEDVAGEHAVAATRRQIGGPHDGLVVNWLAARSAIDPTTVEPIRFVTGFVDILAIALDIVGPQEVVTLFGEQEQAHQLEVLDHVWRLDHPRLSDVLDALGAHHPVKAVAKAARKALVRHRSR